MGTNLTQAPTSAQAGQSQADWIADAASNGWSDPQALLKNIYQYSGTIAPSDSNTLQNDPTLQKLIDQGYLTPSTDGNSGVTTYGTPNIPQSANGWAPGMFQGGAHSGNTVTGSGDVSNIIDTSQITKDPLYGNITANENSFTPTTAFDRYAPMIASLVGGGMLGLGGLAGLMGTESGLGSMGSALVNMATKVPGLLSSLGSQSPTSQISEVLGSHVPATPDTSGSPDTLATLGNNIGLPSLGGAPAAIGGGGQNPMVGNAIRSILASNFQGQ